MTSQWCAAKQNINTFPWQRRLRQLRKATAKLYVSVGSVVCFPVKGISLDPNPSCKPYTLRRHAKLNCRSCDLAASAYLSLSRLSPSLSLPLPPLHPSSSLLIIPRAPEPHALLSTSEKIAFSFLNNWSRFPFPRLNRFVQKHIYIYIRKSSFLEFQKQLQKHPQKEPKNICFFNFFKASKKLKQVIIFRSFLILF